MNLRVLKNQYFLYFFSALKGASLFPPPHLLRNVSVVSSSHKSISLMDVKSEHSPHDLLKVTIPGILAQTDSDFCYNE